MNTKLKDSGNVKGRGRVTITQALVGPVWWWARFATPQALVRVRGESESYGLEVFLLVGCFL